MTMGLPWHALLTELARNRTVCRGVLGERVATQGGGPCDEAAFDDFLLACGIAVHAIPDEGAELLPVVIFGREEWDGNDVDSLWERVSDDGLRVYSQEMVFASLAIGADLWEVAHGEVTPLIEEFITGHPALERFFYSEPKFEASVHFPETTDVEPVHDRKLLVNFETGEWPSSGVLSEMGYRVGRNGLAESVRRTVLAEMLAVQLVAGSASASAYIEDWGKPNSQRRLQKVVNSISAFARNARRRAGDFSEAIADWESDLQWLRHTFT
ncbi:hypothetical protein ASG82_19010 [Mycobacterium sp. Soil538]|nr:hypothetical protein ASG82_19010 [Mycobacterium sp. Soil538]